MTLSHVNKHRTKEAIKIKLIEQKQLQLLQTADIKNCDAAIDQCI